MNEQYRKWLAGLSPELRAEWLRCAAAIEAKWPELHRAGWVADPNDPEHDCERLGCIEVFERATAQQRRAEECFVGNALAERDPEAAPSREGEQNR